MVKIILTLIALLNFLGRRGYSLGAGKPFPGGTVSAMPKNRKCIGKYSWGEVKNNCIPPIIEEKLFNKVQKKLKENSRSPQRFEAREDYILTDKFKCGDCGSLMIGDSAQKPSGKIYRYYKCSKRKHGKGCAMEAISKDVILL